MKKIEIWGKLPPPIGGVTIYLKRLADRLSKYTNVEVVDFSKIHKEFGVPYARASYSLPKELIHLLFGPPRVIHLNSFNVMLAACFLLLGWRHKYGITIHNQRGVLIKSNVKKIIFSLFLNRCSFIIMNDDNYRTKFSSYFNIKRNNIHILPAFIIPDNSERLGLPEEVRQFRKLHDYLLSANAFMLKREHGIDTYGLDLLIELVKYLRGEGINAGLVFCLPIIGDEDYYLELQRKVKKYNLESHILIINETICNAFEYWEISDLFVRPTNTDMEGISVKEALYVGTNVVASDVCKRPDECFLFANRNQEKLNEVVKNIYDTQKYKMNIKYDSMLDTPKEILKIYQSV